MDSEDKPQAKPGLTINTSFDTENSRDYDEDGPALEVLDHSGIGQEQQQQQQILLVNNHTTTNNEESRRTSSPQISQFDKSQFQNQLGLNTPGHQVNISKLTFTSHADDEYGSVKNYGADNYDSLQMDEVRRLGPRSLIDQQSSVVGSNGEGKLRSQRMPLIGDTRNVDQHSTQSFFSRVLEDMHLYRQTSRLHNEENISTGNGELLKVNRDELDDNFQAEAQRSYIAEYTLRAWDFWLYIIGILVRIQTIVLGYILFGVETENTCVVVWGNNQPIPMRILPDNMNLLPGGFSNMSSVFQTVLMMLFITSVCTSIMYILKVIKVVRYHRSSAEVYEEKALPAVRKYKIWNSIFGLSHLACCTIFMTHAGRVCSGWMVGNLPIEERENLDRDVYLFARGGYFVVASVFGLCNLIGFLAVGKNAIN